MIFQGVHYVSIRNLIMCFGNRSAAQANECWGGMPKDDLEEYVVSPGIIKVTESMITIAGAFKLITLIPGVDRETATNIISIMTHNVARLESTKNETVSSIPFDEIVSGATVRLAMINGTQYLSVRDMIMYVCEKNANDAAEVWRNLSNSKKTEVSDSVLSFKFPGRGQQDQPVITFPGALKLVMFLPGETIKKHRSTMVTILTRYFAGDPSLIKEIESNALSKSPINRLARDIPPGPESIEDARKRKHDETETEIRNHDSQSTVIDKYNAMCVNQMAMIDKYSFVCQSNIIDDHAKQVFKDMLLRTAGVQ